jgi:pyridoxal phosphate-dependent aminotransferase EpsN
VTIDPARFGADREAVRLHLEAADIEAPTGVEADAPAARVPRLPSFGGEVSERLFRDGLCLPSGSAMTVADSRDASCAAVRSVDRRGRRS